MDIVVPLGSGSKWDNNELRYSLRSVEEYAYSVDRVIIVGNKPEWLTNVVHIPLDDKRWAKEYNIYHKIRAAIVSLKLEDFIVTNDDIFFNAQCNIEAIQYYYSGTLEELYEKGKRYHKHSLYNFTISNTIEALRKREHPTRHYDIHVPVIYNSRLFLECMDSYDWLLAYGYAIKSLYSNTFYTGGQEVEDCMIDEPVEDWSSLVEGKAFFSIGDKAIDVNFEKYIMCKFPKPSKFEYE